MTKRTWKWNPRALWEVEADFHETKGGMDPDTAMTATALHWMALGNYKPLAAAIRAGKTDPACLELLAEQIEQGRLVLKWDKRGRPKDPEATIRKIVAGLAYDQWNDKGYAEVAGALGMGEKAVEKAVTDYRRMSKKK